MTLMNDFSFEFDKSDYGLNDSDFFKFEDENQNEKDFFESLSEISADGSDFDDEETLELTRTIDSSSLLSFEPAESRFITFLNTELGKVIDKLVVFMEKKTAHTFPEIKQFEDLIMGFPAWAVKKYKRKYEVKYIDQKVNIFLFEKTPVYVHIESEHRETREETLLKVREYLYETLGNTFYVKSELISKHSHLVRLVFNFVNGKRDFIIQAKRKFDYLVYQYIKFCAQLDDKIYRLGVFLTFWANERKLLESVISPNTLYLIMIFVLMHSNPPLLPNLFAGIGAEKIKKINIKGLKKTDGRYLMKTGNVYLDFEQDKVKIRQKTIDNPYKGQLGEMIYEFFTMCHVSILLPRQRVDITNSTLTNFPDNHRQIGFTVVNPFIDIVDMNPNLSRNYKKSFDELKSEFKLACENLKGKKLGLLCEKKKEKEPEKGLSNN
jgi:hypothetical protein